MAMDTISYFENVLITFLIVVTFIILALAFLYMIYGREEVPATATSRPKT